MENSALQENVEYNPYSDNWYDKESGEKIIWGAGLEPDKAPYTGLKSTQGCNNENYRHEVNIKKCGCGASWCPSCWVKRGAKQSKKRFDTMNYKRVRHVVLTIDRANFDSPEQAYYTIVDNKKIPQIIHNLGRTKGIVVIDWINHLEWHADGFPHWHLLIEVEKEGKAGMIHGDNLRIYWGYGAVREEPIKNIGHWHNMTGYFEKHGYFNDEKGHQGRLPEWAMQTTRTIRRRSSKVRPDHMLDETELQKREKARREKRINDVIVDIETGEVLRYAKSCQRGERTYEAIIKGCGSASMIEIYSEDSHGIEILDIPYSEWRNYESHYDVDFKALVVSLTKAELDGLREKFKIGKSVFDLLDGKGEGCLNG